MNVGANSDIHPSNWHPSWHRYAEYGGWAAILHDAEMAGHSNLCVVPAACPPSGDHRLVPRAMTLPYVDLSPGFDFDAEVPELLAQMIERFGPIDG